MKGRFWWGVVLILSSLIIGKINLVLIPILLFSESLTMLNILAYAITWIMLLIGLYLCGKEGWQYSKLLYRDYKRKTMHHVRQHVANVGKRIRPKPPYSER